MNTKFLGKLWWCHEKSSISREVNCRENVFPKLSFENPSIHPYIHPHKPSLVFTCHYYWDLQMPPWERIYMKNATKYVAKVSGRSRQIIPRVTLPPIIMVHLKMDVSPILFVSFHFGAQLSAYSAKPTILGFGRVSPPWGFTFWLFGAACCRFSRRASSTSRDVSPEGGGDTGSAGKLFAPRLSQTKMAQKLAKISRFFWNG